MEWERRGGEEAMGDFTFSIGVALNMLRCCTIFVSTGSLT
jgi:hypothetical protein